jgi:hypothetical protein
MNLSLFVQNGAARADRTLKGAESKNCLTKIPCTTEYDGIWIYIFFPRGSTVLEGPWPPHI